jgi:hypothetical protein
MPQSFRRTARRQHLRHPWYLNFYIFAMPYHELSTPAAGIISLQVRNGGAETQFRPSATGEPSDLLRIRAQMEALEIEASAEVQPGFVASAAHVDKEKAVAAAQFEAVERLSLAAWWALDRPILARADESVMQELGEAYFAGSPDFRFSIGYVEPVSGTGFAAVSILENTSEYPFIVLGGSYAGTPEEAARGAFFESVQSWTGTIWMRDNAPQQTPYWDVGELRKRTAALAGAPDISAIGASRFDPQQMAGFFNDKTTHVEAYPEGSVAWVYLDTPVTGYSFELAELVRRPDETVSVFTQHNY